MKFIVASMAISILLLSCGNSNTEQTVVAEINETPKMDLSSNPDYQKGLDLVSKSDCLGCHKPYDKVVGPSYVDVANKYPATPENINKLANTIIKGVTAEKGVWGKLPMTAHPQISQADAEQMVKYVLLLKE